MAGTLPRARTAQDLNEWRERVSLALPNEEEIEQQSQSGLFELVDARTVRFKFDPGQSKVDRWDVQVSIHPDFADPTETFPVVPPSKSILYPIFDDPEQACSRAVHFRVRPVKNNVPGQWGPRSVFRHPIPGAVQKLEAFHFVDGPETENPFINVNITLPRTATISGRIISDREGQFTDAVELEAAWSTLNGGIDNSQTTMDVALGTGPYFKPNGFYKIDDEIIGVSSVSVDTVTIERGHFGTTPAAHADLSSVLFYAKVLRDQFSANDKGLYGVTVTIPNSEKVRQRTFVARPLSRCGKSGPETNYDLDLPAPALITDLAAGVFFQYIELSWSELPWTAYRYEIYHATTGTVQIADLDPTATGDCELLARPLADHEGVATFAYPIKYDGTLHYFGVRAVDILGGYSLPTGGDTVGPVVPDQSESNPAGDVTDISASEGPATVAGGRPPRARGTSGSVVTCGFTAPVGDPNFNRCKVYLQPLEAQATLSADIVNAIVTEMTITLAEAPRLAGWQFFQIDSEVVKVTAFDFSTGVATITRGEFGTTAASHIASTNIYPYVKPVPSGAEGPEAPLVFHWPSIGEVALYFVSVAADGTENAVLSSPTLNIDLDGQVSPPLEVQNLHAIKTVHGIQLVWSDGLEPDLDHYDVADLGSRTLVAQGDIDDDQIVERIPASPGDSRRVTYKHNEILYEGTIAQGSSTIVLTSGEIHPDRYKPIGGTPVKETLRIVSTSGTLLPGTDYNINSNTDNTIVLGSAPTEASLEDVTVKFYIGQRIHKMYVRAVNRADLASEWRPAEGTFLEPTATAPDGTVDLGVPAITAAPLTAGAYFFTGRATVEPGDGTIMIHPAAGGDINKRNISGITAWVVRVTYTDLTSGSSGLVKEFEQAASSKEALVGTGNNIFFELPASAGFVYVGEDFLIRLSNAEIEMVELAAKNYFGISSFVEISYLALAAGPYYTGNKPVEVIEDITPASAISLDLAKSEVAFIDMQNPVTGITILGAEPGRRFTLIFLQPATPQQVTWNSNFKINQNFQPLQEANTYTALKFICKTSSAYYLEGAPVNGPT